MRRRSLLRGAVLAPASAAVLGPVSAAVLAPASVAVPAATAAAVPPPTPAAAAQYAGTGSEEVAQLAVNTPSFTGRQRATYFDAIESNALRALAATLAPAYNGMPGAVECGVPEFLDFFIAQSPAPQQQLWRSGLDELDARALASFGARFDKLNAAQSERILEPLKTKWTFHGPAEPFAKFLWEARAGMVQATLNSREYAEANTGRRAAAASNYYWRSPD